MEWAREHIFSPEGAIHNPDHLHLLDGDIAFMWAPCGFTKQMRKVLGSV